jgi:hypothetical protein
MTSRQENRAGWTLEAEKLLLSLTGVVAARLVTRPGGEVDEVHLLTTDEVTAKQTVRNVESALLAHLGLEVDHRKISVAQTRERPEVPGEPDSSVRALLQDRKVVSLNRLLFYGHQVETERSHRARHRVEIEWKGERHTGTSVAADLPRTRLEAVSKATLDAVTAALSSEVDGGPGVGVTLALDGVKFVDAFDRKYVLVAVNAMAGRDITPLAGAAVVEVSADRAAILATLQATDRWVRGRI